MPRSREPSPYKPQYASSDQLCASLTVPPAAPDRTDDVIGAVRDATWQQTRDASVGRRRQTGQITWAIADAAQRGELDAVQLAAVERSARLAAQPMLTRYVEDPDLGGKRYRSVPTLD